MVAYTTLLKISCTGSYIFLEIRKLISDYTLWILEIKSVYTIFQDLHYEDFFDPPGQDVTAAVDVTAKNKKNDKRKGVGVKKRKGNKEEESGTNEQEGNEDDDDDEDEDGDEVDSK